jgi:hypothetical protein
MGKAIVQLLHNTGRHGMLKMNIVAITHSTASILLLCKSFCCFMTAAAAAAAA